MGGPVMQYRHQYFAVAILFILALVTTIGTPRNTDRIALEVPEKSFQTIEEKSQQVVDSLIQSIFDGNTNILSKILSNEVLSRLHEQRIDLRSFANKQRHVIIKTLRLPDNGAPKLTVKEAMQMGGTLRLALEFSGRLLDKYLYLDLRNDEFRVSFHRPGFNSARQRNIVFATDSYKVETFCVLPNCAGFTATDISCYAGKNAQGQELSNTVNIKNGDVKSLTCENTCGRWSGGTFWKEAGSTLQCDWNTWGADVIVSELGNWACNDPC
jgi:hypothetical protein